MNLDDSINQKSEIKDSKLETTTKTKVFSDSLKIIYKYKGDTVFQKRIDLKGTADDNYDSSLNMTTIWSTEELKKLNCKEKLYLNQKNIVFSYCIEDILKTIEDDLQNPETGSFKVEQLEKLKKEVSEMRKGTRDSLSIRSYHLNFRLLRNVRFSAYDKSTKAKADLIKIGKYNVEFSSGNHSGGRHYYLITKEEDTLGEFIIRDWIT
ncbi:hypothetical protein [Zunongwangia sp. H14]|uniref:hypothetical protein n=1 Tax=Zunongwangia sp. H14 TaxID=3240792 RepID=UPI0035649D1F